MPKNPEVFFFLVSPPFAVFGFFFNLKECWFCMCAYVFVPVREQDHFWKCLSLSNHQFQHHVDKACRKECASKLFELFDFLYTHPHSHISVSSESDNPHSSPCTVAGGCCFQSLTLCCHYSNIFVLLIEFNIVRNWHVVLIAGFRGGDGDGGCLFFCTQVFVLLLT